MGFVQQSTGSVTVTAGAATLTIAAPASGNSVFVAFATHQTLNAITTPTFSSTNTTWVVAGSNLDAFNSNGAAGSFHVVTIMKGTVSGGTGGTSVSVSGLSTSAAILIFNASEFSGVKATADDSGVSGMGAGNLTTTSFSTNDLTTTANNDLIIALVAYSATTAPTGQPSGYTTLTGVTDTLTTYQQTNYSTSNTLGIQSPSWTVPTATRWASIGTAYPLGNAFTASFSETVSIVEGIGKSPAVPLVDVISIIEKFVKQTGLPFADVISQSDLLNRLVRRSLVDTNIPSDTLAKLIKRALTESINITDIAFFEFIISSLEVINLQDTLIIRTFLDPSVYYYRQYLGRI